MSDLGGINNIIKNYGFTGNTVIDSLILANIIPFIITYINFIFTFFKDFFFKFVSYQFFKIYNYSKNRIFGEIKFKVFIDQNNPLYETMRTIFFDTELKSDKLNKKVEKFINVIMDRDQYSKYNYVQGDYSNVYELHIDTSNDINLEKKINNFGDSIERKIFLFENIYIVVSEKKKKDIKYNHQEEDSKSVDVYTLIIEIISFDQISREYDKIIQKFLFERFKIKDKIPYVYEIYLNDNNLDNKILNVIRNSYKNSITGQLKFGDSFEKFLANSSLSMSEKNKIPENNGLIQLSNKILIKPKYAQIDIDKIGDQIEYYNIIDNCSKLKNYLQPDFINISNRFIGKNKVNISEVQVYAFYLKSNKIILLHKMSGTTNGIILNIISFGDIIDNNYITDEIKFILNSGENILKNDSEKKNITIYKYTDGRWYNYTCDVRRLDTVYLPTNVKNIMINELNKFLKIEKLYKEVCIPYKKGFLLYGPPGTGKTSFVKSIAYEYQIPIYTININDDDINDDTIVNRLNSISGIGIKILLFEDIDSAFAEQEKLKIEIKEQENFILEDKKKNENIVKKKYLTYSGLLNALDGVLASQHGLITIMTTNYIEKLGEALIRPGRIDYKIELGYCNKEQIKLMTINIIQRMYKIIDQINKNNNFENNYFKDNFDNEYNMEEILPKIEKFSEKLSNCEHKIKPCELQVYILQHIEKIDDIFNNYEELLKIK